MLSLFFGGIALAKPTAIFLVRHAEKATGGDAKDPDLSEAGRARAASLAAILKDTQLTAIYATEFKRTQQTAKPLADAAHLEVTTVHAKETSDLVATLQQANGNVLIVGHSNTLPEIIKALGVASPPVIEDAEYDNVFLLLPGTPVQLLRLHFR
ncbi:MAG: phosphoglycerate mutase family protein [Chthoniobacterales bacterium]